jgi:hypothetical protein
MRSTIDHSRHDALVAEGRAAVLAGDKARAQSLLQAALQLDPRSEEAWIWLSGACSAPTDIARCLQQVLAINPHNEQAQEGLRWLETEHGLRLTPASPAVATEPLPIAEPVRLHPPPVNNHSSGVLLEAALHPAAAGVWLGLLRLIGWLRPSTLVLLRGDQGPLGWGGSLAVALAAVALHGLAMWAVWMITGWQLSRVRSADRGDLFDSLVRAGRVWTPASLWLGATVVAGLSVDLSPGPWRIAATACWLLLLAGAVLVGRRLWRLLHTLGVEPRLKPRVAARLLVLIVVGGVLGLGLAGIGTAALLR